MLRWILFVWLLQKHLIFFTAFCGDQNQLRTTMSSDPRATKSTKIKQVLKSAALLPVRITSGKGTGRNHLKPRPGESPVVTLRLQVLGCSNLLAKDRGGTTDP